MTDTDKDVLDNLERDALALLKRATFSIRDEHHAHPVHSAGRRTPRRDQRRRRFGDRVEWTR